MGIVIVLHVLQADLLIRFINEHFFFMKSEESKVLLYKLSSRASLAATFDSNVWLYVITIAGDVRD